MTLSRGVSGSMCEERTRSHLSTALTHTSFPPPPPIRRLLHGLGFLIGLNVPPSSSSPFSFFLKPNFRYKFELPPGGGTLNDSTNITANQNSRWMVKRFQVGKRRREEKKTRGGGENVFMFTLSWVVAKCVLHWCGVACGVGVVVAHESNHVYSHYSVFPPCPPLLVRCSGHRRTTICKTWRSAVPRRLCSRRYPI